MDWKNMSTGVKVAIGIFVFVIIIVLVVLYIQTFAANDANEYLCKLQTSWGMDKAIHLHFTDPNTGSKFVCK